MTEPTTAKIQKRHDRLCGMKIDALMVEELNEANFKAFQSFLAVYNITYDNCGILLKRLKAAEKMLERNRWNIDVDGADLIICKGEHEKHVGCNEDRYVPEWKLKAAQAKIDSLMPEYYPDNMTEDQMETWKENQLEATDAEEMAFANALKAP